MSRPEPGFVGTTNRGDRHRYGQILPVLIDIIQDALVRSGIDGEQAAQVADSTVVEFASYCGGRQIYLPRGLHLKLCIRNARIYKESGSVPVSELVDRYQLTSARIYQIIHDQRALSAERRRHVKEEISRS